MNTTRRLTFLLCLLIACLTLGCPPDGPGNGEGMGEGQGEGIGEGASEGTGEGQGEGMSEGTGEGSGEGMGEMPVPDAADHFFVDGVRGNDNNTARRATPLATIQEAINRASIEGGSVFVAGGIYEETLELASAVEIRGGYDSLDWILDRENFMTMIAGGTVVVTADGVMSARLEGLTILSADATDPNSSSIAVVLNGCMEIDLEELTLFPGNGADGSTGRDGNPGGAGPDGGDGADSGGFLGSCPGGVGGDTFDNLRFAAGDGGDGDFGGGDNGGDGNLPANRIAAGGSGGAGGTVGNDGANGTAGSDSSEPGGPGAGGANFGFVVDGGTYLPAVGTPGGSGGSGGAGGGGGGGGGSVVSCGGGGGGGGGLGRGGRGGEGGIGGGASIGILLTGSQLVRVVDTTIHTGNGGAGGAGGDGGAGGPGGAGGSGGDDGFLLGSGGNGGDGGDGARGGPGGGGGGGPVVGIVQALESSLDRINVTFMPGTPGAGGMSLGGPNFFGAEGMAAETFLVP